MTKTLASRKAARKAYTLGRSAFAKISAVEGICLTPEMEARFRAFDKDNLPAPMRREALTAAFGKAR